MERMPEVRIDDELAELVDARLAKGETWSSLVRAALGSYLTAPQPQPRRRRKGPVASALAIALAAGRFEDRDAAAVGLAKSLAGRLDEHPADAKYLAQRLLAVLVELRLTPAARLGVLGAADTPAAHPSTLKGDVLARLRLQSAARQAGEVEIAAYLALREPQGYESDDDAAQRYFEAKAPHVAAVTDALVALAFNETTGNA